MHEVLGHHDVAVEHRRGLGGERGRVLVALGEVGEHEASVPRLRPRPGPACARGEVAVVGGQRGVRVRKVDSMTSRSTPSASAYTPSHSRVSITNANRWPGRGSLTSSSVTGGRRRRATPGALQLADGRPGDAVRGQPVGQHPAPVGLDEAVAVRLDGVGEPARLQRAERGRRRPRRRRSTGCSRSVEPSRGRRWRGAAGRSSPAPDAGIVRVHRVRHPVEGEPLDDAGQAEAVVAVEVGEADPGDVVARDAGEQHLALGALARVEEDALAVPAQQVAVVVACRVGAWLAVPSTTSSRPDTSRTLPAQRRYLDPSAVRVGSQCASAATDTCHSSEAASGSSA